MVPTINSVALFQSLPNAELSMFPDAGQAASSNISCRHKLGAPVPLWYHGQT